MLYCITQIYITQKPSENYPSRDKTFYFDYACEYEADSSWKNLTDTGSITLPKKIAYTKPGGQKVYLENTSFNLGGFSNDDPAFLRGDEVVIVSGYRYRLGDREYTDTAVIFSGFISKVGSKLPFTLNLEDQMWKLKQIPVPNKLYQNKDYTLESMLREMLKDTPYTVNALTKSHIGDFRTQNESVADVLARLRKDYFFESYFRGMELRCGAEVYIESEAVLHKFSFQENIIEDDLEYARKDDVQLSAIAYSINKVELDSYTHDGHRRTKQERLEVLVGYRGNKFYSKVKEPGKPAEFPPNYTGERRTFHFWDVPNAAILTLLAKERLDHYYYTGLRGKFTTFGIPFCKHGDNVLLVDNRMPERGGQYKVKSVRFTGGTGGLRQEIQLDYRIDIKIK